MKAWIIGEERITVGYGETLDDALDDVLDELESLGFDGGDVENEDEWYEALKDEVRNNPYMYRRAPSFDDKDINAILPVEWIIEGCSTTCSGCSYYDDIEYEGGLNTMHDNLYVDEAGRVYCEDCYRGWHAGALDDQVLMLPYRAYLRARQEGILR